MRRHLLRELLLLTTILILFVVVVPLLLSQISLINLTVFAAMATLALSMALVWGYGGILSFGQSAFFGLGGYAYAIGVLNLGESTLPILFGIIVPVAFAIVLGYFMFYGRVGDIYLGVITLVVSLILYQLVSSTSGSNYRIGMHRSAATMASRHYRRSTCPAIPAWRSTTQIPIDFAAGVLIIAYFGLRLLLASHFGRTIVAIRENERRMEFLGYDVRARKLAVFAISAGIAGLAGVLFANWGSFISPNVFSIGFTAQIIMWIMIGGLGTLIGPVIGSMVVQSSGHLARRAKVRRHEHRAGVSVRRFCPFCAERLDPCFARFSDPAASDQPP